MRASVRLGADVLARRAVVMHLSTSETPLRQYIGFLFFAWSFLLILDLIPKRIKNTQRHFPMDTPPNKKVKQPYFTSITRDGNN